MLKKFTCFAFMLLICCALLPAKEKAKGPVTISVGAPVDKVKAALVARLAPKGFTIESETDHQLVFSREVDGANGVLAQALMGNAYSEKPRHVAYFTLVKDGDNTTVIGRHEMTVRMAQGKVNRVSLDEGKARKDMADMLAEVKAAAEKPE